MVENIREWIVNITTIIIFISFIEILMPSSSMKKYLNLVLGFVVMLIILNPIINMLEKKDYLEDQLFRISNNIEQQEYAFATNNIKNIQKEQLIYLYKSKIKNDIKSRLESRYDVQILEIDVDIKNTQESTGEINKVYLMLRGEKIDIDNENNGIPIVSIDVSQKKDEIIVEDNNSIDISLKNQIKKEISQAYNIKDSNIIIN